MTGKHAAEVPTHVRRCGDNRAYLWYFDKATEIGFEWTGRIEDPIEVSHGGFGEPITNVIDGNVWSSFISHALTGGVNHAPPPRRTLAEFIADFQSFCADWVESITSHHWWASEPQMVREVRGG